MDDNDTIDLSGFSIGDDGLVPPAPDAEERAIRRRKSDAQKDQKKNIEILRKIRDDQGAKPAERLSAIKQLDEMAFDKAPAREPEKDYSDKHVILLGHPSLDMLKRVARSTLENPTG